MAEPAVSAPPRGRILAVTGVMHALDHVAEDALPPVLRALGRQFTLGDDALGWLGFAHGAAFGAMALPAGILTSLGRGRGTLVASLGCAGLGALAAALAPGLLGFTIAIVCLGLGAGLYHPPGLTVVATITERRGRALAFHGLCGNLGIAATPLLGFLADHDWRLAFAVPGVLMCLAAASACALPAPPPRALARAPAPGAAAGPRPDLGGIVLALGLVFAAGFVLKGVKLFLNRDVADSLEHAGLPLRGAGGAGVLVAAAYVMGIFGQMLGGRTLDRLPADVAFGLYQACTGVAVAAMALTPGVLVVLPVAAFAFFHFAGQPAGNELIARLVGPRWRGIGFGVQFAVSFGLASAAGPWVGGCSAAGRIDVAFWWCAALLAAAAVGAFALRRLRPGTRAALLGAAR